MKFKLKKITKIIIPVFILMVIGMSSVYANTSLTRWSGTVDYNYRGVGRQVKSSSSSKEYQVKWDYTDKTGYFRLYVRVLDDSDLYTSLSKALIEKDSIYKTSIGTVNGKTYVLQASRESMWDPSTAVAGDWKIN